MLTMFFWVLAWFITLPRVLWNETLPSLVHVCTSPRKAYERVRGVRDWFLGTVDSLQTESTKWRTAFNLLKSPYSLLRALGFSPQIAGSLLFAGSVAGTGVVAAEIMEGRSFQRGDSGVYSAPHDTPIQWSEGNNTLRIDLGTTPVGEIIISNVTVGTAYTGSTLPSGETDVVFLGGKPEVDGGTLPGFTETFVEIGHLIIDRWRCSQLILEDIEVHTLNVKYNASDGQSIAPVAGMPRARGIGGGNRADSMITAGGFYDQIKIQAPASGLNGRVDVMTLSNIYSSGGPCVLSRIKAGVIDIIYNEIGMGDGFADKDFTIADTVVYKTFANVDNVEASISPP